jgi:hypothetical protein
MDFQARVAEQVARLPAALKQLLDAELAAGNEVNSMETGVGPEKGKAALILERPFRTAPSAAPAGVSYRQIERKDLNVFEFYVEGEPVSLITAKFKPMKLDPLSPGPENPTAAHVERMKQRTQEEEEAAARRRAAAAQPPSPEMAPVIRRGSDNPLDRFLASMVMNYDMWHDGLSYDLDMLDKLARDDLEVAERALISHSPRDWRDIEALARINTPAGRKAVIAGLHSSDPNVRRVAREYASDREDPAERERHLIRSLEQDVVFGGLSQAIDEAQDFHPPAVMDALLRGALKRDGEAAVHFAALLFFLHGKAKEPFDWDHRPFVPKFHATDRAEREALFRELCDKIGVDPEPYLR